MQAGTPIAIVEMLNSRKISAHTASRLNGMFRLIRRHSPNLSTADFEAERYFKGLDGMNRKFIGKGAV